MKLKRTKNKISKTHSPIHVVKILESYLKALNKVGMLEGDKLILTITHELIISNPRELRQIIIDLKKAIYFLEDKRNQYMNIKDLQIRDRACTICNGIYLSGRAVSKKLCDECGEDKKNWKKRK